MKFDALSTAVSLATFIALANAQTTAAPYGQCGGQGWTGPTVCATGWTCVYSNPWYSQCLQGASTSTSTSTSTTTRTTTTTTTTRTTTTTSTPTSVPTGFVKTSGQKFTLNGSTFFHVGTNAYFLAQFDDAKITQAFSEMKAAGYTVVRTWGFNDVTATQNWGAYYQLWTNGVPTINYGPYGLDRFDYVVKAANAAGVKLVVPLVNNWKDYGGMDAYINALNPGGTHDSFYTNTAIINAYKNYIKAFVGRYVNEPAILGWELGNEPRCGGSSGSPSSACNSTMLYNWASSISAYIKSIDKNHLVAIGDEGWINSANPPSYPYQGNSIGIDFDKNLGISTIDWGTFHLYPESWGQSANITGFGSQWIKDHATFQKSKNKPVVIEEYGVTSSSDVVYKQWLADIVSSGVTGALFWQQAVKFADGTTTWDDGYGVYPTSPAYPVIVAGHNAIKARG